MNFFTSTNPDRLDIPAITEWIRGSYWGGWMRPEQVAEALRNSLVFGLYEPLPEDDAGTRWGIPLRPYMQRGFAAVITNKASASAITDVYISAGYRGRGLGRLLMEAVIAHPHVAPTMCVLASRVENQGFYQKYGFISRGGCFMQRDPK